MLALRLDLKPHSAAFQKAFFGFPIVTVALYMSRSIIEFVRPSTFTDYDLLP